MAYNTAMACAQLGIKTDLVSAVGSDFPKLKLPRKLRLRLTRFGKRSTWCLLLYDSRGGERISFYRGPYHDIDVKKAKKAILSANLVHFAGVAPCFEKLVEYAVAQNKIVSFNPGYDLFHYSPKCRLIRRLVELSDWMILSSNEAKYLGINSRTAGSKVVVVTKGKKGSEILMGGEIVKVPAYPVKQKSPFGAGDTYTGALISALIRGKKLADATRLASVAASFAVEEETTAPKLSWRRIKERASKL
jgi:sugar/nucleoside kinase (ribokinase family)